MKKITIIWLFLSIPFLSVSQKVFVPWTVIISDTQSYQDALEIGLNDAKEQALREAGVTEKIYSYTLNAVFEDGENFEEVFNSEIFSDIGGVIDDWGYVKKPTKGFDVNSNSNTISFKIWAKVKKYKSSSDPSFKAKIEWINYTYIKDPITKTIEEIESWTLDAPAYKNGEFLDFKIKFYKDSYLNIFYLSSKNSAILYPIPIKGNKKYTNRLFLKDEEVRFDSSFGYRTNTELLSEHAKILIVITKERYPYIRTSKDNNENFTTTDLRSIYHWVNDIELENRDTYLYDVIISKN